MPPGLAIATYDAVLFDVDGTLVDSIETIVRGVGDTYEWFAGTRPENHEIKRSIGRPLAQQFDLLGHRWLDEEVARLTAYSLERFAHHRHLQTLFNPAVSALKLAKERGLGTALVTSKSARELERWVHEFPEAACVDVCVTASDVHRPKPDPESAFLACARLGVDPARAVFVGDSVFDLRCAHGAGVATVAVSYGAGIHAELAKENPDFLLETPEALLAWADANFLPPSCRERNPQ